jgi:hypothetical protein
VKANQFSRRRFLRRSLLGGAAALATAAGIDGLFFEPRHLVAERVDIHLARLPDEFRGFRLAQISDFHFGPYMGKAGVQRAAELAHSFHPDLIVLTGDFVSHPLVGSNGREGALHAEPCADALVSVRGAPMVAVLGNHDHWNDAEIVAEALAERGIRVLRNEAFAIERGRSRLWISGIDDAFVGAADLEETLREVPKSEATVLLAHEPDFADEAAHYPVDVQFSGHSHGGQVQLPGVGPLVLPALAQKYPLGLNRVGRLQVYTNRGIGVINPPVRFLCPPEVTLVTLL